MSKYPDPPVPPDCDLRGLSYMPLDAQRLRDSDLSLISNGDEFKAAVTLWCVAWAQVPAASLPDDDRLLAALARVDAKLWRKIRTVALHKWVKCSDGRLYHPIVAEKACEAWADRTQYRAKREKDAARLKAWRESQKQQPEPDGNGNETISETRFETVAATRDETQPEEKGTGSEEKKIESTANDAQAPDWRRMLVEATEAAGEAADLTSPAMLHAGDLRPLVEPLSGEPCLWSEVLDAVRMTAARQSRKAKPIRSWTWVHEDAWSLRDKRLNSSAPTVVPLRPGASITDRIAEEHAEAQRRAFARMDAENG